jgi:hypothetical protein
MPRPALFAAVVVASLGPANLAAQDDPDAPPRELRNELQGLTGQMEAIARRIERATSAEVEFNFDGLRPVAPDNPPGKVRILSYGCPPQFGGPGYYVVYCNASKRPGNPGWYWFRNGATVHYWYVRYP